MPTDLRSITDFDDLLAYLGDELDWPIEDYGLEELTFEYDADELGLKDEEAEKLKDGSIRQLRPMPGGQPFGIFFVEFGQAKLPVVVLRRILNALVIKKRNSANPADRQRWDAADLLFISAFGEDEDREIAFAHFHKDPETSELPVLRVLGWDGADTTLKTQYVAETLKNRLHWPEVAGDHEAWRTQWRGAFRHRLGHVIKTSSDLADALASFASKIRDAAVTIMAHESEAKGQLRKLHRAFQASLISDLSEEDFADTYAQTVTYGLLTAAISRTEMSEGRHGTALTQEDITAMVPVTNPFLKEMLQEFLKVGGRKGGVDFDELGINEVVELLRGDETDLPAILRDFGNRKPGEDPVIHFYEHFLASYNKQLRIQRGVFYTPQPVVSYIVRSVHELLQTEFGLEDGLASTVTWSEMLEKQPDLKLPPLTDEPGCKETISPDEPFVQILDPATGTGTFIVEVIEVIHHTLSKKWEQQRLTDTQRREAWNDYTLKHLLCRLTGFELMMAPYAIAHMKIGLKLSETGFSAWDQLTNTNRVRVYLTNSLEPNQDFSNRLAFDVPSLAHEARAVNRVKANTAFTVIVGNPPYLREKERGPGERAERIGGWVRHGDYNNKTPALFDDFIRPLAESDQGVHAKLAYELSVIFWRLALWMAFERRSTPGIIGMISPRAYISGPGHTGMRKWLKKSSTDFWVSDLGGDNRGARKSENIFTIETGVAIGLCVKSPQFNKQDYKARYAVVEGSADQKLAALQEARKHSSLKWKDCQTEADTFMPVISGRYSEWPKLTDLFPWQHSGSQFKRLWPIAESPTVLNERWQRLVCLPASKRASAYIETRDRLAAAPPSGSRSKKYTGIEGLEKDSEIPKIIRYCYRTLDRQWAFCDERLADYIRPSLVNTLGSNQVFAFTLMSKQLGIGPAVGVSHCLPDMDVFCNRGAKDVIPLWRDSAATQPNIPNGLLARLKSQLELHITPEDVFCYCIAILAGPCYGDLFKKELATPGPRIPITTDSALFRRGVLLGAQFIWLQTYGMRWIPALKNPHKKLTGSAKVAIEIPEGKEAYPTTFSFDEASQTLQIGDGSISGVTPEVFAYNQSGLKPVESWLRYRMKERAGRARGANTRSELDQIRPDNWVFTQELLELLWVVEGCVLLWPALHEFLGKVVDGDQFPASDLPMPTKSERKEPTEVKSQSQMKLL